MVTEAIADPVLTNEEIEANVRAELELLIQRVCGELKAALLPEVAESFTDAMVRADAVDLLIVMFGSHAGESMDDGDALLHEMLIEIRLHETDVRSLPENAAGVAGA